VQVLSDVAADEDATAVTDVSHIAVFTSDAFAGPLTKARATLVCPDIAD